MSSDYLNYELSKELHDLGVVFDTPWRWAIQSGEPIRLCYDGIYLQISGKKEDEWKKQPAAPSTAQLIDEIQRRDKSKSMLITVNKYGEYSVALHIIYEHFNDPCFTTALGKALIGLVKEGE